MCYFIAGFAAMDNRCAPPAQAQQVRYGWVWLFPGDPELAAEHEIPEIPELIGDNT